MQNCSRKSTCLPLLSPSIRLRSSEWGSLKTSWFAMFKTRITLTPLLCLSSFQRILHFLYVLQRAIFSEHRPYELEKKSKPAVKKILYCLFNLTAYTSIFPDKFTFVVQSTSLHLPSDKAAHLHTAS